MNTMTKTSEKLQALVTEYAEEEAKFIDKGNNSAGTRARKKLMEIIKACKDGREEIQQARKDEAAAD
jgi:hypothetical protein